MYFEEAINPRIVEKRHFDDGFPLLFLCGFSRCLVRRLSLSTSYSMVVFRIASLGLWENGDAVDLLVWCQGLPCLGMRFKGAVTLSLSSSASVSDTFLVLND